MQSLVKGFLNFITYSMKNDHTFRWYHSPRRRWSIQRQAKETGTCSFSTDTIALDVAVTRILGFRETFCTTNPEGYTYEIIADSNLSFDSLKPPITMNIKIPSFLKKWVTGKVHAKPFIIQSKCIKCGLCKKAAQLMLLCLMVLLQ